MKKILPLLTVLLFLSVAPTKAETNNIQKDVVIAVDGMVCDFCAQSIKKVFGKQDAVNDVGVDLDKGEITLDLKDDKILDNQTMTKLVTDAGYTVRNIDIYQVNDAK